MYNLAKKLRKLAELSDVNDLDFRSLLLKFKKDFPRYDKNKVYPFSKMTSVTNWLKDNTNDKNLAYKFFVSTFRNNTTYERFLALWNK
jgi:hypothetical protein